MPQIQRTYCDGCGEQADMRAVGAVTVHVHADGLLEGGRQTLMLTFHPGCGLNFARQFNGLVVPALLKEEPGYGLDAARLLVDAAAQS